MKRILALSLTVLMVFALFTACTPATETTTTPPPATTTETAPPATTDEAPVDTAPVEEAPAASGLTTENITLKMWESETVEKDFILYCADEFTKLYPNITFEYEPVGHVDASKNIALDGPAGIGPDVFAIPHDMIGDNVSGGFIRAIDNKSYIENNFVDAGVKASLYTDGNYYGYPTGLETYALFYNKDILPNPPTTWEEVIAFAGTYNDPKANKYAIVWETGNAYFDYFFFSAFGSELFGPNGDDPKQHNINAENTVKGLEYFGSLRSILDVPAGDMSGDFCNSSFEAGLAAMYIVGPWKIEDFKKSGVNFGVTTLPKFPGQSEPPTSFSGIRMMVVSEFTEHPAEAEAFLEFLTSKEMLLKRFEMTSQIPPRNDITVSDEYVNGIIAQAAYAFAMPKIPAMGEYWSTMGNVYTAVWNGGDAKTELDAAAVVMEAAVQ